MQVPAFLLRRLYVKGSLRNVDGGFAFDLRNTLGTGYADAVLPLVVDGDQVPPGQAAFDADGTRVSFADIAPDRPFTLAMDRTLTVRVDGRTLADGPHTIGLGFIVTGIGEMAFEVTDAVTDAG
ncbi:MAG: hypothetical protein WEC75_04580 [Dehalococcoidia bacterium]